MKKILRAVLLLVPMFALFVLRASDDIPTRPNFDRYNKMLQHSPFAVATAVAVPAATPAIFKDLYVANAAHTDQADFVTVISGSDRNFREYLSTEGPEHGFTIANIQWSDKPGETKVTISKDGQFATIGFNQALMAQPTSGGPQPQVVPPTSSFVQPPSPNMPRAPMYPSVVTPTPHVRPMIPRNPSAQLPMPNVTPNAVEE